MFDLSKAASVTPKKFQVSDKTPKTINIAINNQVVIYDWGKADLLIYDDGCYHSVAASDFLQAVGCFAPTATDQILALVYNGIEVEIMNYGLSFKNEKEKDLFYQEIKKRVAELKKISA